MKPKSLGGGGGKGKRTRNWLMGWWPGKGKKGEDGGEDGGKGKGDEDDDEKEDGQRKGRGVPEPRFEEDDCEDCFKWTYIDGY